MSSASTGLRTTFAEQSTEHPARVLFFPATLLPATQCHHGPDDFNKSEGPCALEKSVDRSECTEKSECQYPLATSVLQRVANETPRHGEKSKCGETIQLVSCTGKDQEATPA